MKEPPPKIHCLCEDHNAPGHLEVFILYKKSQTFQLIYQENTVHPPSEEIPKGCIDKMQDFQRYPITEKQYYSILGKLEGLSLRILPPFQAGFGGDTRHLWLRNGYAESSFTWWSECPTPWRTLELIFEEIVSLTTT